MSTSTDTFRYWAFISYSSKDAEVAEKLHKRLETYRIPRDLRGRPGRDDEPIPAKLFPIFRDRDELPLSADLGGTIKDALSVSRYLIVLCSPNAAQSQWVNKEISYFKSLGRQDRILAIILNGEPNASDKPDNKQQECFPVALRYEVDGNGELTNRRIEPIGGDLRQGGDGWNSVFLKAVAGITGLGYDAFARRERKRRRLRQGMMAAAGLILLICGLLVWDYYRTKTIYYANMATRYSIPTGIGKLDRGLQKGRQFYYRFETSERRVRRVERINSAGVLRDEGESQASSWEVFYNEDATLQHIDLYDKNGKHVMRKKFSKWKDSPRDSLMKISFLEQHNNTPLAMSSSIGSLNMQRMTDAPGKTEITVHRIAYDDRGRVHERRYFNQYARKRTTADGIHGQRFFYDERLKPKHLENFGLNGKPLRATGQIASRKMEYNSLGDVTRRQYFDGSNRSALNAAGVAESIVNRNKFGNLTEGTYLGVKEEPVRHKEGKYHRWTQLFDERGNRTKQAYFGFDDDPVLHSVLGAHAVQQYYDDSGNIIRQAYYGFGEKKVLRADLGYHAVEQTYVNGKVSIYEFFDVSGQPALRNDLGAHRIEAAYDRWGNMTEQAYFGRKGNKVLHRKLGYHKWTQTYNENDDIKASFYHGINGEPVVRSDIGVHLWRAGYNEEGNRVLESFYGPENKPVVHKKRGYHGLIRAFDEQGNVKEIAYFGTDENIHTIYCVKTDEPAPCPVN